MANSNWTKSSIRELESAGDIGLGRGKIISKKDIEADPGNYPVYSSSARGNGEFGRYGKFMFDEELVTWSVDGGGKFFYRPESRFSITNVSGFLRVLAKDKLDTYYTWAHLFSIWETMTFNYTEKLHPSILRERFSFSYPPLPEQKNIAHILSTVQRAIEAQERIIQVTAELFKSMLHQLMTAQIRATNGDRLKGNSGKCRGMTNAVNGWQRSALGELSKTTSGGTPSRKRKDYFDGNIPWVKSGELNDGYLDGTSEHISEDGFKNSSAKLFSPGTLLIALYGATVGKTAILRIKASTNQAVCGITPGSKLDTKYLRFHLMHLRPELLSHRYGGAQPNISQQIIRNLEVDYPPLPEQKKIGHILSIIQQKVDNAKSKKAKLQDLFRTLLHELMTAKIRVHKIEITV